MIYPSIDKLLNQVGSKYLLVNIVSKRAKKLQERVDRQGGGEKSPAPAFYAAGQPVAFKGGDKAVSQALHGGVLQALRAGRMDGSGGTCLSDV